MTKTDPKIWRPEDLIDKVRDRLSDSISQTLSDLEDLETLKIEDPEDLKDWRDPETGESGVLTLEDSKSLQYGQIIYSLNYNNADQTPQRYKINGRPKTWKRSEDRVKVPLKRGLWEYGYLTESDLDQFSLSETFASLDHNRETDSDKMIKTLQSQISSLQGLCMTIGDQIKDFESGHSWIRPDSLTEDQTEDLETLSRVSRSLSIFLRSIVRDLRIIPDKDPEDQTQSLETLRLSRERVSDLFSDPEDWTETAESLRELTVSSAMTDLLIYALRSIMKE